MEVIDLSDGSSEEQPKVTIVEDLTKDDTPPPPESSAAQNPPVNRPNHITKQRQFKGKRERQNAAFEQVKRRLPPEDRAIANSYMKKLLAFRKAFHEFKAEVTQKMKELNDIPDLPPSIAMQQEGRYNEQWRDLLLLLEHCSAEINSLAYGRDLENLAQRQSDGIEVATSGLMKYNKDSKHAAIEFSNAREELRLQHRNAELHRRQREMTSPIYPIQARPDGTFMGGASPGSGALAPLSNSVDYEDLVDHALKGIEPIDFPSELNATPLIHQKQGLGWLVSQEKSKHAGGILADDMGLGKTVQTIALTFANKPPEGEKNRLTLVICPLSLLDNWRSEFDSKVHAGSKPRVYVHHDKIGDGKKYKTAQEIQANTDIVLTTYESVVTEYKNSEQDPRKPHPLFKIRWWRVVIDEAHIIKNFRSIRARACAALNAKYRLCLTGTPMQNKLEELWPLLRFLRIEPYSDHKDEFLALLPKENDRGAYSMARNEARWKKLHILLANVLLRRTKETKIGGQPILGSLPPKTLRKIRVKMLSQERQVYDYLESSVQSEVVKALKVASTSAYSCMLVQLLRLRQGCLHPLLSRITLEARTKVPPTPSPGEIRAAKSIPAPLVRMCLSGDDHMLSRDEQIDPAVLRLCCACGSLAPTDTAVVLCPCAHTVCQDCAASLEQDYPVNEDSDELLARCPTCEETVEAKVYFAVLRVVDEYRDLQIHEIISRYEQWKKQASRYLQSRKEDSRKALDLLVRTYEDEVFMQITDDEEDMASFQLPTPKTELSSPFRLSPDRAGDDGNTDVEIVSERMSDGPSAVKPEYQEPNQVGEDAMETKEPVGNSLSLALQQKPDDMADNDNEMKDTQEKPAHKDMPRITEVDEVIDSEARRDRVNEFYKLNIDKVAACFEQKVFHNEWVPSSKTNAALELLMDIWSANPTDKVIVFSFFTSYLDVLTIPLNAARIEYLQYTGAMPARERTNVLNEFKTNPQVKVLLISLKAGNVGLTLTAANRVIIMEPFWNPYVEEQARDRVHRIGQSKPVTIYNLVTDESVEDRIIQLQDKKRSMIEGALSKEGAAQIKSLSKTDLMFALGLNNNGTRMITSST